MIEPHLHQWRISVLDAFSLPSGFLIKSNQRTKNIEMIEVQ